MTYKPHDNVLDIGIQSPVIILNTHGVDTFESCQGGPGHAFVEPTIRFHGGLGEGMRAFGILSQHGYKCGKVAMYWNVIDGVLHGPYWEIELEKADVPPPKEVRLINPLGDLY